jgi:histidyl-tRNA synthetase
VKRVAQVRPPRGFRDFPPNIMILKLELISKIEDVFRRYGFDPLDTPAIEYWETLAGKYGEEAESKLIWRFQDPLSGRWYALRYDLTVPMARFVASNPGLQMPFKRYHIGKVWRHEEPQRGRFREFTQCDADIVGSPYPEADAEIVSLTLDAMDAIGLRNVKVRVNDRRLLAGIFEEELGLENPLPVYRVIDKLDKIGAEGVRKELERLGLSDATVERIMEIISVEGKPGEVLEALRGSYGSNEKVSQAISHLEEMFSLVDDERVVLDLSLVRGLDYYTGPIIEVVSEDLKVGSIAGGGRYDGLIGLFAGRDIPATGVSIGIDRIIDAGLEAGVFSAARNSVTQVYIVVMDRSVLKYAWLAASKLRAQGLNVRVDLSRASPQVQRRKAGRMGVPIIAFVGRREAEAKKVTLYSTRTGERVEVRLDEAGKAALKML